MVYYNQFESFEYAQRGKFMKKFLVVSGFLGAGKTTFMIALTKYLCAHGIKASLISNDLGSRDLVDTKTALNHGCSATELTGECICYQTENLVDRLRRLLDYEHNEFTMSDIPGCGVGALEMVYHKLNDEYHGEFDLAPFTVVVDPERLRTIMPEQADINLPQEMNHLFRAQLREADVVLLNKTDTVSENQAEECMSFLRDFCPEAEVFAISAKNEEGIGAVADWLIGHSASLRAVDIGITDEEFAAAEEKLSWYNRQFYVKVCCNDFDGNAYMRDLAEEIRQGLQEAKRNVPHLKLYAETEQGACKISLTGVDYALEFDCEFSEPCVDMPVIINARAACEAALFSQIIDHAMTVTGKKYQLEIIVFFTECFGMMDEGRI